MIVGKGAVRELCHEVDNVLKDINDVQAEIDRVSDKIDAELESSSDKLDISLETLEQVAPLADRLVRQIAERGAPDDVQVLVGSVVTEIMSKVNSSTRSIQGVKKNNKDVDKYTDRIDELTDGIKKLTKKIDSITDRYQK